MTARALLIGAPRSGSGKTTLTLGLLAALAQRGVSVRGIKSGPDYIDTAFHAAASGKRGLNLDSWAMPPRLLDSLFFEAAADTEMIVVESAMGLFDGVEAPPGRSGSAADLSARFGIPVLLILDVSGQAQTAAAIAKGFATLRPDVRIGGVILNRVGSDRHRRLATRAIEALAIPVLGAIQRDATLTLPERHLGLVQAQEHGDLASHLERLRQTIERSVDLEAIFAVAMPLSLHAAESVSRQALPPPGQRIALAADAAFSFVYPHLLAGWRQAGAEIVAFSPLADEPPRADCDICWLPGGYPELHAGRLAAAETFRSGMRSFAATGPVHGECGGYMVLGESLTDAGGVSHAMLGLLGHATSLAKRRMTLGYREARLTVSCPLGVPGGRIRGHEFHYAQIISIGKDNSLAILTDGQGNDLGPAGARRGKVSGTFFHAIASTDLV